MTPEGGQPGQDLRLLLVDDEEQVRTYLTRILVPQGFAVATADSGETALTALAAQRIDLVILDVGLPGMTGFDTLAAIRRTSAVPAIMVTAADTLEERVEGFDRGADDYIVKPFAAAELLRRVEAVLRRTYATPPPARPQPLAIGGVVMDVAARAVAVDGQPLALTRTQFDVLYQLLSHRGNVVTFDDLSRAVWGYETIVERGFVETQISRIRARLAEVGLHQFIRTIRGVGYIVDGSR